MEAAANFGTGEFGGSAEIAGTFIMPITRGVIRTAIPATPRLTFFVMLRPSRCSTGVVEDDAPDAGLALENQAKEAALIAAAI